MKRSLACLLLLMSCKTPAAFITPNEVHRENVMLVFRDQTKQTGVVNIFHENYASPLVEYNGRIEFMPAGGDSLKNIDLNRIAGYWYGGDFYALKKVDIRLTSVYRLLFVKRLTGEQSTIQLYELYESGRGNNTGESQYSYFISLPSYGPLEAANTRSDLLIPSFDRKMSALVADCPALAQKILAKDQGYFIPMTSFNIRKHPDVLLRIIHEYDTCH